MTRLRPEERQVRRGQRRQHVALAVSGEKGARRGLRGTAHHVAARRGACTRAMPGEKPARSNSSPAPARRDGAREPETSSPTHRSATPGHRAWMMGSESAQNAAGAVRTAEGTSKPPSDCGKNVSRRAAAQAAESGVGLPPKRTWRVSQIAWSWALAYPALRSGGSVRSRCWARGAAQYKRRSQAHCRSGKSRRPCAPSRRAAEEAATNAGGANRRPQRDEATLGGGSVTPPDVRSNNAKCQAIHLTNRTVKVHARCSGKASEKSRQFFPVVFCKLFCARGNTRIKIFQPAPNSSLMIEKKNVFVGPKSFRRLL